jgi:hypothetical protein
VPDPEPRRPRERQFNIRIDAELYAAAMRKAQQYGLGPVIRALLRAFVRGDVALKADDLLAEMTTAPRGRKPRKSPKRP